MEATISGTIQIRNSEDFAELDLTKLSPKQIFSYNCTNCGKYYEKKLYRLQQFDFELLCYSCSRMKNAKPRTKEQKKATQEKRRQTNLERYGVAHLLQSKEIQEKVKQTNLKRYGVENYAQSKEMQAKRKRLYRYSNVSFDSKPELAFYVYCKDRGIEIERNSQKSFTYEFEGRFHGYFPDFVVNEEFVEIKEDQFLNETTGAWQNPFDSSQDDEYEAKHQCAIQNNVKILYSKDYRKCVDYVIEKYGKDFFENCKI